MIMKRLCVALAASILAACGLAAPASAEIVTLKYKYPTTKTASTLILDGTQRGATNIYDINSVVAYIINGTSQPDFFYFLSSQFGNPNAAVALDQSFIDFNIYGFPSFNSVYAAVDTSRSIGVYDASVGYGGTGGAQAFVPANLSVGIGAPGAPAPLLGLGLLPALAGMGGLAATRRGRKLALSPAFA